MPGNNNNCYPDISCQISTTNGCNGAMDPNFAFECTTQVRYYADPTTSGTPYVNDSWFGRASVSDKASNSVANKIPGVELNPLIALSIQGALNYGSFIPGSNTGTDNKSISILATGNVGLDIALSGVNMSNSATTGGIEIESSRQQYSLANFNYGNGIALSSTPVEVEINIPKTKTEAVSSRPVYWGIGLPEILPSGTYRGSNTIIGILGEIIEW